MGFVLGWLFVRQMCDLMDFDRPAWQKKKKKKEIERNRKKRKERKEREKKERTKN